MEENKYIEPNEVPKNVPDENLSSAAKVVPETGEQPSNEFNDLNKNMEVHHHAHESHGKKTWKDYFWEFLMLFLAVFCGFLAEYQLEHKIERERAGEYASLLIKDLENDTIAIKNGINQLEKVLVSFDSISSFVYKGVSGNKVPGSFYYHSQIGTLSPQVIWNDATLIQLTQSGNLRYFRNQELVNKISSYYARQSYVRSLNNGDRERREKTLEIRSRIVNNHFYTYYSKVLPTDTLQLADSLMTNIIPIQNSDSDLLNEYANSFENRRGLLNLVLTNTYPAAISSAKELILLLKKEYHLE